MATGQSDFTQTHASRQAQAHAPGIRPRSPDPAEAWAERADGSGPAVGGSPGVFPGDARSGRSGRRRYAWLWDDEDIWGGDGAGRIPSVIDGDDWRAPRM